jgi:hypothetical protein
VKLVNKLKAMPIKDFCDFLNVPVNCISYGNINMNTFQKWSIDKWIKDGVFCKDFLIKEKCEFTAAYIPNKKKLYCDSCQRKWLESEVNKL